MHSRIVPAIIVAMAVSLVCDSTSAQQGGGRRGQGGGGFGMRGPLQLLNTEQVQKELKLTDDQVSRVKTIAGANRPQRGGGNNQRPTEEERAARRKQASDSEQEALALLNTEQKTRLEQVRLWAAGSRALTDDAEVAKKLNLTSDQQAALKTIGEEAAKKRTELTRGQQGANDEAARKKLTDDLAALRTTTESECLAVLTADQKTTFDNLRGPKFELDRTNFPGRTGGRRGQRAN